MGKKYTSCNSGSCSGNPTVGDCDFTIKQGDTCPEFKIEICDPTTGLPVSFEDWTVEVYMYFLSSLRSVQDMGSSGCGYSGIDWDIYDTIKLLGNENLCQVKIGDIIGVEDCNQNLQEFMLVSDIDYECDEILVLRGYGGSDIYTHKRGDKLIFYRIYGKSGYIDSKNEEDEEEGIEEDFSVLAYNWGEDDTSHRGTYFFEFKVRKEAEGASGYSGFSGSIDNQVRTFPLQDPGYKICII